VGVRSRIVVGVVLAAATTGLAGSPSGDAAAPERTTADGLRASDVRGLLNAHNVWRAKYGVPPLVWDTKLAAFAQQWANKRARTGAAHRPNNPYGENAFWAGGIAHTAAFVVNQWGNEVKNYDLAANVCKPTKVCGHFTQVVWKTTKRVGCGRASGKVAPAGIPWKGKNFYWVCDYAPRGNVAGRNFTTG